MNILIEGNPETLRCTRCGHVLGKVSQVDDYDVLQLGGSLVKNHDGVCSKCGMGFHWHMSDQSLARLVKHVLDLRTDTGV